MAGKRPRASGGSRPKANNSRKKKEKDATSQKKQTSLLSFWGVRAKPKSKTVDMKDDKAENSEKNVNRAISTTPSTRLQPENKEVLMDTAAINNSENLITGSDFEKGQASGDKNEENLFHEYSYLERPPETERKRTEDNKSLFHFTEDMFDQLIRATSYEPWKALSNLGCTYYGSYGVPGHGSKLDRQREVIELILTNSVMLLDWEHCTLDTKEIMNLVRYFKAFYIHFPERSRVKAALQMVTKANIKKYLEKIGIIEQDGEYKIQADTYNESEIVNMIRRSETLNFLLPNKSTPSKRRLSGDKELLSKEEQLSLRLWAFFIDVPLTHMHDDTTIVRSLHEGGDSDPNISTESKLTKEQSSVTITPCKAPLPKESNEDSFKENEDEAEEPNPTEGNDIGSSSPAPIHDDGDDNSDKDENNDNEKKTPESPQHGLSEYEKLRLRNIERNNARLAALGLLTSAGTSGSNAGNNNRRRPPRKRPKIHAKEPQQPLRRSSRNRNPKTETRNLSDDVTSMSATVENIQEPEIEEEMEEQYTVSPLLQYEMSRTEKLDSNCKDSGSSMESEDIEDSSNMCLRVTGPRFIPPKGLNAIYSLEFWKNVGAESSKKSNWMVGAGKAGMIALWDTHKPPTTDDSDEAYVDPILSWKAHSGRWVADAKFLSSSTQTPSRLLTAGNDGTVCLWDLSTVSASTGAPKLMQRTDKSYHSSGIFCMDVCSTESSSIICTGSKDKTVVVSSLNSFEPFWRSDFHTSKVGAVQLRGEGSNLLLSASDDGLVGLHDYRANDIVAELDDAHARPHSVVWDPLRQTQFATAGLDPVVKIWDQRNLSEPLLCLQGHVPTSTSRCKRIHRPVFFNPTKGIPTSISPYVLTGGQGSSSVSVYKLEANNKTFSLCSRGKLPADCGDSGQLAVNGKQVAVTVDQGEILLLEPTRSE